VGSIASLYLRAYPQQGGAAGIGMAVSAEGVMRHVLTWGLSAALIVSGVVFWLPVIRTPLGKVAVVLGNASYSAYLASSLLIEFTARFLVKLGGPSVARVVLFQIVIVGVVFLGGWISYHFVERPMTRWLQEKL
jgi:exopolysaccharide production protein ExoZ